MMEVKRFANKTPPYSVHCRWVFPTALLSPQKHFLKLQELQLPLDPWGCSSSTQQERMNTQILSNVLQTHAKRAAEFFGGDYKSAGKAAFPIVFVRLFIFIKKNYQCICNL